MNAQVILHPATAEALRQARERHPVSRHQERRGQLRLVKDQQDDGHDGTEGEGQ